MIDQLILLLFGKDVLKIQTAAQQIILQTIPISLIQLVY